MGAGEASGMGSRRRAWIVLRLVITAALVPASVAFAEGQTPETQRVPVAGGGSYTDVSAAGLAAMLQQKDFPLINVHVPYEGEIPGTDLVIPFDQIQANLGKLPADRSARLVLYCRSGRMSAIAARTLVRLGYTDVWNLDGGMIGWRRAGYPIVRTTR